MTTARGIRPALVRIRSATGTEYWAKPLGHDHYMVDSGMTSSQVPEDLNTGDIVLAIQEEGRLVVREKVRVH